MKKVTIYTDGACSGNPGVGGWAAILIYGKVKKELSGAEPETTNNRMELMGVLNGLLALKEPCSVEIYSDSAYTVNAFIKGWLEQWKRSGWKTADKKPVKNADLWKRLDEAMVPHYVEYFKVEGHSDNELNNACDALARQAITDYKANNNV